MSESIELYASVSYIKHKVDALEKIQLLNLRSNRTLREDYVSILQSDDRLLEVYKEIDGVKSQKDIAVLLGINEMMVSRKISRLNDVGLIEIKDIHGKQRIYKHSIAEKAFALMEL